MNTSIQSTMILKSYKAEKLINTRNLDESKILNSIQEFIKLHDESELETCLADILFCITLTGTKNKQESKKWNVKLLNIYDISIEINQIIQSYLDLEEEQLAQQLIEELNACDDEKPCVLGDSLFDDEDEDINVFVGEEKETIKNTLLIRTIPENSEREIKELVFSFSDDDSYKDNSKILNELNKITHEELNKNYSFDYEVIYCMTIDELPTDNEKIYKWIVKHTDISRTIEIAFLKYVEYLRYKQKQLEEKNRIQEQINQANADEIEEEKESSPYVSSSKDRTFQGYEEIHLDKTLDYSDEMTVDTVEDLPQSSTIEKLEQACIAIATVSITTMLLSGAVLMTALAIHQVKTLF